MIDVIRSVHAGQRHLPADIAQEIALHAVDDPLSDRDIAVLDLAAAFNANKQIAWKLKNSEETVTARMRSIFSKLDVSDRPHAVTTALKRGIIKL